MIHCKVLMVEKHCTFFNVHGHRSSAKVEQILKKEVERD